MSRCAFTWILVGLTACGAGTQDGSGGDPNSGDGDTAGDGDGDGDGDAHEQPCESEHEGMICIPAGPFIMGSNELRNLGELAIPEQQVLMSRFHIDRHEVTFGEYRACVDAGVCTPPTAEDPEDVRTAGCRWGQAGIDAYPVACVDWLQAAAYCEWRGATLPTEAQWEKAGRGTEGHSYPWGNEDPNCQYASVATEDGVWGCGTNMAELPGSHSPHGDSPYGVQDMVGNVSEVVADWLGPGQPNLGADPTGPDTGTFKVRKGSAYHTSSFDNRHNGFSHLAWRGQGGGPVPGSQLGPLVGFRCAISG